jgi:alpha-tubulin suppressor-like RCC1 family protein
VDVERLLSIRLIAAGGSHTCALTDSGGVSCWGSNKYGQLGDGLIKGIPTPIQGSVEGTPTSTKSTATTPQLGGKVLTIAAGHSHTCAIIDDGRVKCWGKNEHGELGNGTTTDSSTPVEVTGLESGARAVVAGWGHTCVVTNDGGVKCWGYNKNGELGNGKNRDSSSPVDVIGLASGVQAIDAGDDHTCAVTNDDGAKCWGYNKYGQLGDGTILSRNVPVDVAGLTSDVVKVAAGWGHSCALTSSGGVKCWGNNEFGQLGDGTNSEYRVSAMYVQGLTYDVMAITSDGGHTCVVTTGGAVKCWGNNKYGQLGDGSAEIRKTPVDVVGLSLRVLKLVAGWNHTCAIARSGEMACWGWNFYGQLGNGIRTTSTRPVDASELMYGAINLSLGWAHTCIVTDLGGVQCWGWNEAGQLGDGTTTDGYLPVDVIGLQGD